VGLPLAIGDKVGDGVHVGAGVGTGAEIDVEGEGLLDLFGIGLLCATGTLATLEGVPGAGNEEGAGEPAALCFTGPVGNPTGASPPANNESSPPVNTT
jgi:hypothetical protein